MGLRWLNILWMAALALTVSADRFGYTEKTPLTFGLDMDYAPMQYVDTKGEPKGFDVKFTKLLMERMDIPFTYAPNTWEAIANDVLDGKVDLSMMVYSPYRKDSTNYSRAVFRLYYQIVLRQDMKKNFGLRNVKDKSIAIMKSRPIEDTLTKAGAKPIIVKDLKRTFFELSSGQYDAVICFRYQARYIIESFHLDNLVTEDLTLTPREYCYVSHDKRLIDAINDELDKMEKEGVIDEVYGGVKTEFGGAAIPRWVWWLIGCLLIAFLLIVIYQQHRNHQRLLKEIERAKKSEELKDIFLSNLSHSLRTPLNAIIGFSDLLMSASQTDMPEEERDHLLGLINENGLQLLHLINELLSLSDIEGKQQLFNRVVADIDVEMGNYASETRLQMNEGVKMEVIEPVGGLRALVDINLMRLVVMHLLDNARLHTTEGTVTLSYYAEKDGLHVEVKDTGSGLPEKLKDNIFTLLSDKNTYVQEDTPGLGLSICKAIIDKTGGKIGACDNEADGHGTIVWIWVPIKILN